MKFLMSSIAIFSAISQPTLYQINGPSVELSERYENYYIDALQDFSYDNINGVYQFSFNGDAYDGDTFYLHLDISEPSSALENYIDGYTIYISSSVRSVDNFYFKYTVYPLDDPSYIEYSDDNQQFLLLDDAYINELVIEMSYTGTFILNIRIDYLLNNSYWLSQYDYNIYQNQVNNALSEYNNLQLNYENLYDRYNNLLNHYQGLTFQQIYNQGYNAGLTDGNGNSGVIMSLFTAVASVPISILNAVMGPTLFGVPIVSILLTFLAVALMLWLIRRFM